ncbi:MULTISPECIES: phage capsid protein [Megasphaera]|uniref:Coat protein, P22 domain protein n=1 Tax=Megasphaera vaginalis (ex Srinivasan et al. 2021) TaxID=1111454 RepID=U7UG71_9FIRM|nr:MULTISPECIES: phage capsid protein [Megasphaera]ERT58345.1 coat protein, P22 domain protein [Megasphaera vaginalis (ex Srinivasan et al. 2021)]
MAISTFIPTIWEARLLAHLDKALVYGNLCNRDYEGDISQAGDTVKINQIGDIAVRDYKKAEDITLDDVDGTPTTLKIDQQKYFGFKVDDVDAAQANVNLIDGAMQRASYAVRDVVDQYIAAFHKQAGVTDGLGSDTKPLALTTAAQAYEALVDMKGALDDQNVRADGRFVVVPSWFYGLMLKDNRFVAAGTAKTDAVLTNGFIGTAAGFSIYQSNNVPNTAKAKYKILAGTTQAISYASQIAKTEAFRPEKSFCDAVKGLFVYGAQVVQPKALACMTANPTAGA